MGQLEQLAAMAFSRRGPGDAVADADHRAHLGHVDLRVEALDLAS